MCWKSGFGDGEFKAINEIGSPLTAASRLRSLEFGERVEEDGTPAGRERRATLDRMSISDLVAKAESLGLRATTSDGNRGEAAWSSSSSTSSTSVLAGIDGSTGLGLATSLDASELASARRSRRLGRKDHVAPIALPFHQMHSDHHEQDADQDADSLLHDILPTPTAIHPPLQALVSPPLYSLSNSLPSSQFFDQSPSLSTTPFSRRKPFSYKTHFKRAYLTESAWLRGPGRLLSTQMSADDGVVTSLGFDNEWIVVGMATSKVHIFEAQRGTYVKTLDGHELGVWCLTLVSKGGGPRSESSAPTRYQKGKMRAEDDDWSAEDQPSPGQRFNTAHLDANASYPGRADDYESASNSPKSFYRRGARADDILESRSSTPPRLPRRRSFQDLGSSPHHNDSHSLGADGPSQRTGGMGIGAGGETGDSWQQAGVCGTARGWGQSGAIVVSGGCDRDVRVWDIETG